ncbi:hypothetical protein QYE77_10620 [Thermanaerothrix sp. 4228-RoL]|jgi:hypothetical protein|uniref:AMMECR1 domain-containing protein n=1 Tax=Thermanaerothrix solaris TaxID=3058434 RepID=A0ABU3NPF1_9CHLR|nr:hypothetical protein [Thermanaerothrix sp. 4228-RoL]MDT8898723.1 hypothetical protein [Thermanaerothrix sp. 4228-RoL]
MAKRPVFIPNENKPPFVIEKEIEFEWIPGQALSQVQKCIQSFHAALQKEGIEPVLEISSKSPSPLGVRLSAFNLKLKPLGNLEMSVESAFQGSKVFEGGGPFQDLYLAPSKVAKKDPRLSSNGKLIGFRFLEEDFPAEPLTAFYDWLYLNALYKNQSLARELLNYKGFTDIAFNPKKSLNCQARSAALYVALYKNKEIEKVIQDKDYYLKLISNQAEIQ